VRVSFAHVRRTTKVKVTCQSSKSQEECVAKLVGATANQMDFSLICFQAKLMNWWQPEISYLFSL